MAEPTPREVNDTEVINADQISEETPEEDDEEETVIPPVDEETQTTEETETEDEPSDSSPEDTDEEPVEETEEETETAEETEEEPAAPSQKPAPVPGETPREKALRLEVQRLKGLRRKEAVQEITQDAGAPAGPSSVTERLKKLRETYSEDEIKAMEEAIDVLAESRGFVKKSETYQASVNDLVEQFTNEHPEYKPENDPEDVRWTRFEEILKSGIYNVQGKTPKELKAIFERVHKDVTEELGEPTVARKPKQEAAQRQKIRSVSHSGGTKPAPTKKPAEDNVDPQVRGLFKGFDDEDLV